MIRKLNAKFLAGVVAAGLACVAIPDKPAHAAVRLDVRIGFNDFYVALAPHGRWFHHARWGDVWMPAVANGWSPYRQGHWDYTDEYGWIWVSDYSWGDIPFHYGRWVYDPQSGWLWIPGYIWAPAWVLWRSGDGYVGWFPMPPDEAFLAGYEVYPTGWADADRAYGYMDWYGPNYGPDWFATNWVFVNAAHFADRDYGRFAIGGRQAVRLFHAARDITRYENLNNHVVNRSVDPGLIGRARGRPIAPVPLRQALRPDAPVVPINLGRQVQETERRAHGGNPRAPANAPAEPLTNGPGGRFVGPPAQGRELAGPQGRQERANRGPQNREFIPPVETGPQGRVSGAERGRGTGGPPAGFAGAPAPGFPTPPAGFAGSGVRGRSGEERRFGNVEQGRPGGPPPGVGAGPAPGISTPPPGFAAPPQPAGNGPERGRFGGPPQGFGAGGPSQFALGQNGRRGGPPGRSSGPPPSVAPQTGGPPPGPGPGPEQGQHAGNGPPQPPRNENRPQGNGRGAHEH